ncbi:MAG: S8 family serine peptidase [Pseudomonadota bacterium]
MLAFANLRSKARPASLGLWWLLAAGWLLAACDTGTLGQLGADAPSAQTVDSRQVIALLPSAQPLDRLMQAAEEGDYVWTDTTALPSLGQRMVTFEKPVDVTGAEAIAAFEAAEPRSTVGINHAYHLQVLRPGKSERSYALALLDWPDSRCRAHGSVGVIDTQVDPDAPNLVNTRVVSRQFTAGQPIASRHGTEVASQLADPSMIAALTIYNAIVVGQSRNGGTAAGADDLIRALDWLAGQDVRVVNLSLAGPFNKLLDLAVSEATSRGMVLIAAVGNAGPNVAPQYPAAFPSVIAVTAIDADRDIYRNAVRGPFVDFAAPGVDVFIPSADGGRFVTGTSIAAPFVTARIVADEDLMRDPKPANVRASLAVSSEDLGRRGADPVFGSGLPKATALCH